MALPEYDPVLSAKAWEFLRIDGYLFTFWADNAVQELRILDITELR